MKYQFIAVEGNIGTGKTTFCRQLASDYNCRLLLEEFADNPFLAQFYENPERFAFPVELFFMTERHKQLQENLVTQDLFNPITVADYYFVKTLLFAKQNLKDDEYSLFQRIYKVLNTSFPKPDILIYLHRPVEVLLKNIAKRGRDYERNISPKYLETIQTAYFDYFKTEFDFPILIVDVGDMDFKTDKDYYKELVRLLETDYRLGVNTIHIQ